MFNKAMGDIKLKIQFCFFNYGSTTVFPKVLARIESLIVDKSCFVNSAIWGGMNLEFASLVNVDFPFESTDFNEYCFCRRIGWNLFREISLHS